MTTTETQHTPSRSRGPVLTALAAIGGVIACSLPLLGVGLVSIGGFAIGSELFALGAMAIMAAVGAAAWWLVRRRRANR